MPSSTSSSSSNGRRSSDGRRTDSSDVQLCFLICGMTVEPIFFAVFLATSATDAVATNALLIRTCLHTFNYTEEQCTSDPRDPDIESAIQVYVSNLNLLKSLLESVSGAIFALFMGPWSDWNGRKPCLLLPLGGYLFYFISWIILLSISYLPSIYFLIPSVFPMVTGGYSLIFTAVSSYINDVTTVSNRGFRMTVLYLSLSFGILLGYFFQPVCQWLLRANSVFFPFFFALVIMFFIIKYTLYCVPETITFVEFDGEKEKLFTFVHIKEMFGVCFAQRPSCGRLIFFIICLMIGIDIIVLIGDSNFRFMVLHKVLDWSVSDVNIFSSSLSLSTIFVSLFGMWIFTKVCRMREIWVVLIISLLGFWSSMCLGLSTTSLDFYLAANLGVLISLFNPSLKAEVSKIFPSQDSGKVYSFLSAIESLTPFLSSACYTAVYEKVVDVRPQGLFFLSAAFWIMASLLAIVIITIQWYKGTNYTLLIEQERLEDNTNQNEVEA